MASNKSPQSHKPAPLSFMERLNSTISYFDPKSCEDSAQISTTTLDPQLILLLSWSDANDAHIAKYVQQHRQRFPSSKILLIRCSFVQYCIQPFRTASLMPALPVLRELVTENEERVTDRPTMLVHIFSNAGVSTAVRLWELLSADMGSNRIPHHVTVFDSCPGYGDWGRTQYTLSHSLPRWSMAFSYLILGFLWMVYIPTGYGWPQNVNAEALNAANFLETEKRRTYIYGTKDKAVAWQDVEKHAKKAEKLGVNVRTELFEGGAHVAHSRLDSNRYWEIVTGTWQ